MDGVPPVTEQPTWGGRRAGSGQKPGHPGYGGRPQIKITLRRGRRLMPDRTIRAGESLTITAVSDDKITLVNAAGEPLVLHLHPQAEEEKETAVG
jgi:hypothetical protein